MRYSLLSTVLVMTTATPVIPAVAQALSGRDRWADTARVEIETAYTSGDVERVRGARALVERALTAFPADPLLEHYYAYALHREVNLLMGRGRAKEEEYRPLLKQADSILERSAAKLPLAETHALRSSVLGQLINNPLRGMTLGPQSGSAMDRALELGPRNPRVWLLRGVGAMFTPTMFGGGADRAEEYLRKAIALFPSDRPAPPLPAWGHAEAYAWLGQALHKQKRLDDARAAYAKSLELQPENGWVRHVLLPALDRAGRD
jgi:tetratricopeptide (TPR) repeat protein